MRKGGLSRRNIHEEKKSRPQNLYALSQLNCHSNHKTNMIMKVMMIVVMFVTLCGVKVKSPNRQKRMRKQQKIAEETFVWNVSGMIYRDKIHE